MRRAIFTATGWLFLSQLNRDISRANCSSESDTYVIVKYGGSAITEKSSFETLKKDILISTAQQIEQIRKKTPNIKFIIVHGAGALTLYEKYWCLILL